MLGNIQRQFATSVSQRRKTIWSNQYNVKMHFGKLNALFNRVKILNKVGIQQKFLNIITVSTANQWQHHSLKGNIISAFPYNVFSSACP